MARFGDCSCQWPKDNLYVNCSVHEKIKFKYHWHVNQYELIIVLSGTLKYIRGKSTYILKEDDVIVTNPNEGHACYSWEPGTIFIAIHFTPTTDFTLISQNEKILFNCCSSGKDKNHPTFKVMRGLCAKLIFTLHENSRYSQFVAKACLEMIISILLTDYCEKTMVDIIKLDEQTQRLMETIIDYIEEHYRYKITLETIGSLTGYNRTYLSTLFQKSIGICFRDYLMLVRLQNAKHNLTDTKRTLTDIALGNGFPDLRAFNHRFREVFHYLPSDYRRQFTNSISKGSKNEFTNDEMIQSKVQEWQSLIVENEFKILLKESFSS